MTERFGDGQRNDSLKPADVNEFSHGVESIGHYRDTIRQLIDQIDAADMHDAMTTIIRESNEDSSYAKIDFLQKCIAIVQAKLSRIQSDMQREEKKKVAPQAIRSHAEAELNKIYLRRVAITSERKKLHDAPNSTEKQIKLQELRMEYAVTSVNEQDKLLDARIDADAELMRLDARLSILTEHENIRKTELAEYDLQLRQLASKPERVAVALAKLASVQLEVQAIIEEPNDVLEIALPQKLPELEVDRSESIGVISDIQADTTIKVSVDNIPILRDEASSLAVSSSISSISIPLTYEMTPTPALAPEKSLDDILKEAKANNAKPTKTAKGSRFGKLLEYRNKR